MDNQDIKEDLKPTGGDVGHTIAKAGLASIPVVGGAAAEIFSAIIVPPLSKRRDKWIISIAEGLKELEDEVKGFKAEELSKNDTFITTVTHATQAAIRNHQAEKLEALRNAVLNSALPNPISEDIQLIFLNFIDTLTPCHLRVLKFFENPRAWGEKHGITYPDWYTGSTSVALEHTFPELSGKREFYDLLVKDLFSRGLMNTDSLHTTVTGRGMLDSHTTAMGQQFISFITSPIHDTDKDSPS
jgi:hypothetical protein